MPSIKTAFSRFFSTTLIPSGNCMEHQSSINPNMPLRLLIYIAHVYEKIINRNLLYKTKLEKIPTPEFIVLYNAMCNFPLAGTDQKYVK